MFENLKIIKRLIIIILLFILAAGCSNCKKYYVPVDHANDYMNIDVDKYEKLTFKRSDGEIFEAIIYEKCK